MLADQGHAKDADDDGLIGGIDDQRSIERRGCSWQEGSVPGVALTAVNEH